MSKHTPGPWYVGRMPGWSCTCILGLPESEYKTHGAIGDKPIAQVNAGSTHWEHKYPVEANARLIAAAPDLLEIVEAIVFMSQKGCAPQFVLDENSPLMDAARTALRKALGESA